MRSRQAAGRFFLCLRNRDERRRSTASSLVNSVAVMLPSREKEKKKKQKAAVCSPPSFSLASSLFSISLSARRCNCRVQTPERDRIRSASSTRTRGKTSWDSKTATPPASRRRRRLRRRRAKTEKTLSPSLSPLLLGLGSRYQPTSSPYGALSALSPQAGEVRRWGRESLALRGRREGGEESSAQAAERRSSPSKTKPLARFVGALRRRLLPLHGSGRGPLRTPSEPLIALKKSRFHPTS